MVQYINHTHGITSAELNGFFVGWPNPPRADKHLEILNKSAYIWLAIDDRTSQVIGFITAISDQVLSAYIPLLEVLPQFQRKGIGSKLVEHMLNSLDNYYMVDLLCDRSSVPFYKKFKMIQSEGMIIRNYHFQSGS